MLLDEPEIFRRVVDGLLTGVYLTDCDRRIVFWNQGAERITGFMRHEVVGRGCDQNPLTNCSHSADSCSNECRLAQSIRDGKSSEARIFLRYKAGHRVPVRSWLTPVRNSRGQVVGATESSEVYQAPTHQVHHHSVLAAHGCLDSITGLPNQRLIHSHLRESLALLAEHHLPLGVVGIRMNGLSSFQMAHSREARNTILHVSAQTISHALGPLVLVGRWSDDQFLAVIPECDLIELERFGQKIREVLCSAGIRWWGETLLVSASVGWTMAEAGDTIQSITERMQRAMFEPGSGEDGASPAAVKSGDQLEK